jgi:oligopeptide transport system ATP-binding protein
MAEPLVFADRLVKHYPIYRGVVIRSLLGRVRAVDGVSFTIEKGTTFGLVGESGCGKTTIARLLLRIQVPTQGVLRFRSKDIAGLRGKDLKEYRRRVQAVLQDPYSSLSPRMRVSEIIAEPLLIQGGKTRSEIVARVNELLRRVGLSPTAAKGYPHQFSGGQRQRIAIARALAPEPELLILDEPTSALDMSTRAQIMNLLMDLHVDFGLTVMIISHDLPIVRYMSEKIAVMYLGEIVESGSSAKTYANPLHPYTRALLSAVPRVNRLSGHSKLELRLSGEVPSAMNPPSGCRFHTRCPFAFDKCHRIVPELQVIEEDHSVACHLFGPATLGKELDVVHSPSTDVTT